MKVTGGGTRSALFLIMALLATGILAGCTANPLENQSDENPIPDGEGLVTLWMSRPAGAMEHNVQSLTVVPRFVVLTPADQDTIQRTNATGYVDVAKGWTEKEGGWAEDDWPKSAQKNWLNSYDIWYQNTVPAGNYSEIRIEIIDEHIILWNAQPRLHFGNTYESAGNPRLIFQPDPEVGVFQVKEGEELVLNFQTTLELQRSGAVLIR